MSHQFSDYYISVSERLSHILDNVGYSREERNRKVKVAIEIEALCNIAHVLEGKRRFYILGSRGEGSTGPGLQSDIDELTHDNLNVVTDLCQCQPEMNNVLMVKDNHTHSGYVKLQLIILSPDYTLVPVYLKQYTDLTSIDSLGRTVLTSTMHHNSGTVSGPAVHYHHPLKELSIDDVFASRCSQWPQEGYEWFLRRRLNGWPTPIQIEAARKYGCFVTPVGHPHSSECHLEHRLSFSIAERDLIRSLEDTTMKVYILLKMIRKTFIQPVVGDAFSSYHCKVCMFWMRERTPNELWSNQNLLQCLVLCIKQLYEWATTGFCPDYFIITNNIYDRKIIGAVRNKVEQILINLISSNGTFLLGIQCCNLGHHMSDQMSIFNYCIMPIIREEAVNLRHHMANYMNRFDYCISPIVAEELVNNRLTMEAAIDCRYSILKYIQQHYSTLVGYLDIIMYASKHVPYIMHYPLKYAMMIMWSQLGFHLATICKNNVHILSREQVDYLVALASCCLSFGMKGDATSVRLKLCGLGIEHGDHNLVEASLQHINDYHMRYIYSDTIDSGIILICNVVSSMDKVLRNRYTTEELLQTQTSFSVVYLPTEMSITPKPLRMEMFRSIGAPTELRTKHEYWFDWGVVDSRMCLYFFQYLNFCRQGKERHKEVAMYNMIYVIRTEPMIPHRDTAFNLLGYSFMQENQLTNAFICFMQSLKICPYHNAAKLYLILLFNRMQATDRGYTH